MRATKRHLSKFYLLMMLVVLKQEREMAIHAGREGDGIEGKGVHSGSRIVWE